MSRPLMNKVSDLLLYHVLNKTSWYDLLDCDRELIQRDFVWDEDTYEALGDALRSGVVKASQLEELAGNLPKIRRLLIDLEADKMDKSVAKKD